MSKSHFIEYRVIWIEQQHSIRQLKVRVIEFQDLQQQQQKQLKGEYC